MYQLKHLEQIQSWIAKAEGQKHLGLIKLNSFFLNSGMSNIELLPCQKATKREKHCSFSNVLRHKIQVTSRSIGFTIA